MPSGSSSTFAPRPTRAVHHDSEIGSWEMVFGEPAPRLRAHVRGAYVHFIESAATIVRRLELPYPGVVLIINFGARTRVIEPRNAARAGEFSAFVGGLYDTFVHVEATGASHALEVHLTPQGAFRFLGLPMDSIANRCVDLGDVLGAGARELAERLGNAPDCNARFALLDAFLLDRLNRSREPSPGVSWAYDELLASGGCADIGALAAELGHSRKHLITCFREQIGLAPKTVARIIRFDRVVHLIDAADGMRWSEVALRCGYYDQAHLIRDFNEFAGSTPSEFVMRRLPDGGGVLAE